MNNRSEIRSTTRREIAASYLRLAQQDMNVARATRLHYAHLGRSYGMTFREIGQAIGVTDTAVRHLLERNPADI